MSTRINEKSGFASVKIFITLSAALICFGCRNLNAGLTPDYDTRCDAMKCKPAEITSSDYFQRDVPKNVHQIWFGDHSKLNTNKTNQWRLFSEKFGYKYTLWTEKDDDTCQTFMKPKNFELMIRMRQIGNYWSASDILRYELIKAFGGVYIDFDFSPPSNTDGLIDLQNIVNFHGLTLMTEPCSRDIGTHVALFVANGFIVAPENNPVICSLVDQVYDNAMSWYAKEKCFEAMYVTGPFLVNKVLFGCYNIVPCTYLRQYHMWTHHLLESPKDPKKQDQTLRASRSSISRAPHKKHRSSKHHKRHNQH